MIFQPVSRSKVIARDFPPLRLGDTDLKFVNQFKHLGHLINDNFNDNDDIEREIRLLFMHTNILKRRFSKCSLSVKHTLFTAYCMCLYDIGIWSHYSQTMLNRLQSCYVKCIKALFGYHARYSVTDMLMELDLPTFSELFSRSLNNFQIRWYSSANILIHNANILGV
jgi:hypothetical protein